MSQVTEKVSSILKEYISDIDKHVKIDRAFLFSLARKYKDICIEPVAFTTDDLNQDNPFVKEILLTGKEISLH